MGHAMIQYSPENPFRSCSGDGASRGQSLPDPRSHDPALSKGRPDNSPLIAASLPRPVISTPGPALQSLWQQLVTLKEAAVTLYKRARIHFWDFEQNPPILVYQMGKVGSLSVYHSLRRALPGRPVFHVHFLTPETLSDAIPWYRANHIPRLPEHIGISRTLVRKLDLSPAAKPAVITLVRDPIEREISGFFQHLHWRYPRLETDQGQVLTSYAPLFIRDLRAKLAGFNPQTDHCAGWFDREIRQAFGINVYSAPFDYEKGYRILSNDKAQVLVIRLDNLNEAFGTILPAFLGLASPIEQLRINETRLRDTREVYKDVVSTVRFPPELCELIYSTPFARHFFTEAERSRLIARWSEDRRLLVQAPPKTSAPLIPSSAIPCAILYTETDLINEAAGLLLALAGRTDVSPELLRRYPRARAVLEGCYADIGQLAEGLQNAVREYDITRRVPLLGVRTLPIARGQQSWALPAQVLDRLRACPQAVELSQDQLELISKRLANVDWMRLGLLVEGHLRNYFGIRSETPLSVALMGGAIWKEKTSDLDFTVIVEDLNCYICETGGSRPLLQCRGIRDCFPPGQGPTTNGLDIALYGLGAITNGSWSHDLMNTLSWTGMNGIFLRGEPVTSCISDYVSTQMAFVGLGYALKHSAVAGAVQDPKFSAWITGHLKICVQMGEKYGCSQAQSWRAELSRMANDPHSDCYSTALMVAEAASTVFTAIKSQTASSITGLLDSVLGCKLS